MTNTNSLHLYKEITLLSLGDDKGTFTSSFVEYAVAGAALAELLLDHCITVDDTKKQLVRLDDSASTSDPIIDACIEQIRNAKKPRSLKDWVSKLAGIKELKHKVAQQLVDDGILKADKGKVLLLFSRRVYPEIDPKPEEEIVERLRTAIFTEQAEVDARTAVLISLADGSELLSAIFGRKEIKNRKDRIAHIVNGDLTGQATKEVIEAMQAALVMAAIIPAMVAATSTASS